MIKNKMIKYKIRKVGNNMLAIETGKELIMRNVLSVRRKMTQNNMQEEMSKIGQFFENNGIKKTGPIVTTTFGIEKDGTIDMEILVPMSKIIDVPSEYRFKQIFKLENAVYVRYEGNPKFLQSVYNEMISYIHENNLQQITTGYNVTVRDNTEGITIDEVIIDVYIGVSSNIL